MNVFFEALPPNPVVDRFVDISYDFSGQIIRLLKKHEMTQHQLAVKLKKKDSEISRWLQGNHNFTLRTIAALEVVFDERIIKVNEVVPYEDEEVRSSYSDIAITNSEKSSLLDSKNWVTSPPISTLHTANIGLGGLSKTIMPATSGRE